MLIGSVIDDRDRGLIGVRTSSLSSIISFGLPRKVAIGHLIPFSTVCGMSFVGAGACRSYVLLLSYIHLLR